MPAEREVGEAVPGFLACPGGGLDPRRDLQGSQRKGRKRSAFRSWSPTGPEGAGAEKEKWTQEGCDCPGLWARGYRESPGVLSWDRPPYKACFMSLPRDRTLARAAPCDRDTLFSVLGSLSPGCVSFGGVGHAWCPWHPPESSCSHPGVPLKRAGHSPLV